MKYLILINFDMKYGAHLFDDFILIFLRLTKKNLKLYISKNTYIVSCN